MRAVDRSQKPNGLCLAAFVVAATLAVAASGPAHAGVAAACDELASSPSDPGRVGAGVAIEKIDAPTAIDACQAALTQHPGDPWLAFELGRAREASNQFQDAARLYAMAVDGGHLVAPLNLGLLYVHGRGVAKDVEQGLRLMARAAERGLVAAQLDLGMLYRDGAEGVGADEREAARYFKLAADQGDPRAEIELARLYREGRGDLPRDLEEAGRLVRRAAVEGYPQAPEAVLALGGGEIVAP